MKGRTRKFWILVVFVILSIGGGGYFFFRNTPQEGMANTVKLKKEEGYFSPFQIYGYSFGKIPFLDTIIGDKTYRAKIDLSYNGMLSLPAHLIKEMPEKEWVERIQFYGMRGKTYERDLYKVKKIQIQHAFISQVFVEEESLESIHERFILGTPNPGEDHFGTIGWGLFVRYNLFMDCKNHTLALCDSVETLKKQGYPIDSFAETSMTSNLDYIEFEAQTEEELLCCRLDTGSTFNFLNKNLENGCNDHLSSMNPENRDLLIYDQEDTKEFSSFKIGGKEFGPLTFHRIKCPLDIDVILGMEFFNSHLVFIDFKNEKIYFAPNKQEKKEYTWMGQAWPFKP